ncbi:pilus assembly protein TadE [Pseudaminobacter manganicus]|uniref:Pilus assembly protein TadE n=2 Tax=Manganibacter manganicus TaxID=1873176 RepID=A0A1V8RNU5_9HYPH|nr:TadE/TadG family type IV pilus assembly protein [Pseudaminobacter manganicus]OQM74793.1 pilus assembly protein TadE [Pseudaminobacter manganicus]
MTMGYRGIGRFKPRRDKLSRRFVSERNGSTAIEFAMLAIPFSLLVFAILESCISFAGQEVMANATDSVARQLRTGQLPSSVDKTQLKQLICDKMEVMVAKGCPGLMVDLRHFGTFTDAAQAGYRIANGEIQLTQGSNETSFKVDPGPASSKNMLRVFYKWPVITDFLSKSMSDLKDGKALHFASVTWQNEPFDN